MEDTGTSVVTDAPQTEELQQQAANKAELDRMMQINLNGGRIPDQQPAAATTTPVVTDNPPPPPPITFESLKDKFGYESPEIAIQEIEQLRSLKEKPPVPEPIKYENEVSEKIAKALQAGKLTEVYQALDQQEKLNSLTTAEINKDTAASIIKLGMQLKHKDLTPAEIDYRYNKQFAIPKEPIQKADELDEDFAERKSEWQEKVNDIEMNRIIEAKLAKPELEAAKSKIIFPEPQQQIDEGYAQYQKMVEQQIKDDVEVQESYRKMTPDILETKVKFTDEANKIDFEFQYKPEPVSFQKTIELVSDFSKLASHFRKPDGTPDREGFAKAMHFALNANTMLTEAMNQSKNATIKASLPDNSGGTQRQFPQTQQVDEIAEGMRLAGIKRA